MDIVNPDLYDAISYNRSRENSYMQQMMAYIDNMGALIGITSVTSAVKYGINQLQKAGLSDSIIKKMTGASETVIQGCLLQEDNELKQIINTKVLMADWYYEF